jgi:methyl-accepting chemotaxis protein
VIQKSDRGMRSDDITALRQSLSGLKRNFDKLVAEQRTLGFEENEGLRNNLRTAGNAIERAINENMTWLADADAKKLMIALLTMRHHEAE